MHELSIAYQLVELASNAARDAGAERVAVVHVRLGAFAGVVRDALLFSFDIATEGTPLAGARLMIEDVPLVVHCAQCNTDVALPSVQSFRCPVCNTPSNQIVQGRELELTAIEIAEESHVNTTA